ncbi:MAG: 3-beta hydroxysteroid dehydrogenase [Sphingobacteriales bacterium UTBCD1]|jgi:nucleoside-diphosphate-sugar epimerase|nr:MAG: 3-beta hydroxysteroid dehydrogenase [Sphingobacteriales bacterium UTBCD1]
MVLVTGGTGFVGSYIIKELVGKNYPVRAIRRSNKFPFYLSKEIRNKVEWADADILDPVALENAMAGVDSVIHAAGVVSFIKKERKNMYMVNVEGTANVVNAALEKNIRRFIHISSVAALGRKENGAHVNEEKKWEEHRSNTHYAKSKYKGELEVWRGMGEGLNAVILNPSTVLGFGDWNNSSCAIFKKVYTGFRWYSNGLNGFVDVEDVARAAALMMESTITEERFIVSGFNWPFRKLQDAIADGFGKKHPSKQATTLLMSLALYGEQLRSYLSKKRPLLTKETVRVAQSKTCFENDKILGALKGFSFTPLEQTIREACKKYTGTINALQS